MDLPPLTSPEGLFDYLMVLLLVAAVLAYAILYVSA